MSDYIRREDAILAVTGAKLPDQTADGVPIANGKRSVTDCVRRLREIPAAAVREVVTCGECVFWQKPQVWQNDGTFRDYQPGEYESGSFFGGVSLEVGVNFGSFCALYDREHKNELPQFMNENDFCSKGYKAEAGE